MDLPDADYSIANTVDVEPSESSSEKEEPVVGVTSDPRRDKCSSNAADRALPAQLPSLTGSTMELKTHAQNLARRAAGRRLSSKGPTQPADP